MENQRKLLDSFGKSLGVQDGDLSPWYQVTIKSLQRAGASSLVSLYGNSIYSMLKNIYPEFNWIPMKFEYVPKGLSSDPKILEDALKILGNALKSERPEDLSRASRFQLKELGIDYIIRVNGGLKSALAKMRPTKGAGLLE